MMFSCKKCVFLAATLIGLSGTFAQEPATKEKPEILQQTQIKGLLVVELSAGEFAGAASQMNATTVKTKKPFEIGFNQSVGELMKKATAEVDKFISVRYKGDLPANIRIEFSFADKYSPKDGPSAAVVCALMADSILSGKEIDQGFAATGDMTAAGEVQPVGGVPSKISGAIRKNCTHVGIPVKNESSITDSYIIDGIESLYKIQIFLIETYEQAHALAMVDRPENVQKAIEEFAMVQKALNKDEKFLTHSQVRQKLKNIVKLTPNHLSARLLYLHSIKKSPKKLSIIGSLNGIDKATEKLSDMLKNGTFNSARGLQEDELSTLLSEMARLRPSLDKRSTKYADSITGLSKFIKQNRDRRQFSDQLAGDFQQLIRTVNTERERLLNNKDIREEIME